MASFVGSFDDFTKYISPRARNVVNSITRNYKTMISHCERCDSTSKTLEAAHKIGMERTEIIRKILQKFTFEGIITVDLDIFESLFLQAHNPIEEVILVLCRDCHLIYDSQNENHTAQKNITDINNQDETLVTNRQIADYFREIVPLLTSEEIENLMSLEYCKSEFSVNFPVLKKIPSNSTIQQIRELAKVNGYNRWSTKHPKIRGDSKYLILTQWVDRNREPFVLWRRIREQ